MRIRNHVNAFGKFQFETVGRRPSSLSGVEMVIDYLSEISPEPTDLYEIVDAGTQYSLQPAE